MEPTGTNAASDLASLSYGFASTPGGRYLADLNQRRGKELIGSALRKSTLSYPQIQPDRNENHVYEWATKNISQGHLNVTTGQGHDIQREPRLCQYLPMHSQREYENYQTKYVIPRREEDVTDNLSNRGHENDVRHAFGTPDNVHYGSMDQISGLAQRVRRELNLCQESVHNRRGDTMNYPSANSVSAFPLNRARNQTTLNPREANTIPSHFQAFANGTQPFQEESTSAPFPVPSALPMSPIDSDELFGDGIKQKTPSPVKREDIGTGNSAFKVLPQKCENRSCTRKCVERTKPYCMTCFEALHVQPKAQTLLNVSMNTNSKSLNLFRKPISCANSVVTDNLTSVIASMEEKVETVQKQFCEPLKSVQDGCNVMTSASKSNQVSVSEIDDGMESSESSSPPRDVTADAQDILKSDGHVPCVPVPCSNVEECLSESHILMSTTTSNIDTAFGEVDENIEETSESQPDGLQSQKTDDCASSEDQPDGLQSQKTDDCASSEDQPDGLQSQKTDDCASSEDQPDGLQPEKTEDCASSEDQPDGLQSQKIENCASSEDQPDGLQSQKTDDCASSEDQPDGLQPEKTEDCASSEDQPDGLQSQKIENCASSEDQPDGLQSQKTDDCASSEDQPDGLQSQKTDDCASSEDQPDGLQSQKIDDCASSEDQPDGLQSQKTDDCVSFKPLPVDPCSLNCDVIICLWNRDSVEKGRHPLLERSIGNVIEDLDTFRSALLLDQIRETTGGNSKAESILHCKYDLVADIQIANALLKCVLYTESVKKTKIVLPIVCCDDLQRRPEIVTRAVMFVISYIQKTTKRKQNLKKLYLCVDSEEDRVLCRREFNRVRTSKKSKQKCSQTDCTSNAVDKLKPLTERCTDACATFCAQCLKEGQEKGLKCQQHGPCLSPLECCQTDCTNNAAAKLKPLSERCTDACATFCVQCLKKGREKGLKCQQHGPCLSPLGHKYSFAVLVSGYDSNRVIAKIFSEETLRMARLLKSDFVGVSDTNVKVVTPNKPSRKENLKKRLSDNFSELRKQLKPDRYHQSCVYFYYSGHCDDIGLILGGPDDRMTPRELKKELYKLNVVNILVILDCCYSGATRLTVNSLQSEDFTLSLSSYSLGGLDSIMYLPKLWNLEATDSRRARGRNTKVHQWSSCIAGERSYHRGKCSLFTDSIVKVLQGRCPLDELDCETCKEFREKAVKADVIFLDVIHESILYHVSSRAGLLDKQQQPQLEGSHDEDFVFAFHRFSENNY